MAKVIQALLIGGLSAEKFVNRPIKVDFDNNRDCPCKCIGVDSRRHAVVVITNDKGRPKSVQVNPSQCHPWWAKNPDLKVLADNKGITFDGSVNVGRALFEAIKPEPRYRPPTFFPACKSADAEPEIDLTRKPESNHKPIRKPTPESEPILEVETTPEPTPEPEPTLKPEPTLMATAQPVLLPDPITDNEPEIVIVPSKKPTGPRKLVKIEAPADADWMQDYSEFKRLQAALAPGQQRLAELRQEILKLEESLHEDQLMSDLHIEQLEAMGVVLHWEGVSPSPLKQLNEEGGQPAPIHKAGPRTRRKSFNKFSHRFERWLDANAPVSLTFPLVLAALGATDSSLYRTQIRETLLGRGWRMAPGVGRTLTKFTSPGK